MIGDGSGNRTTRNAADQSATSSPSDACRAKMKALAQITDGAADYDIVVTEQESAKGGDTGRHDQRNMRMGLDRRARQVSSLAELTLPARRQQPSRSTPAPLLLQE